MSDNGFVDLMQPRELAPLVPMEAPPSGGGMIITATNGYVTAQRVGVPRDDERIKEKITKLAKLSGSEWYYSWPTKNKDGTVGEVTGLTVKGANAVARLYGNNHVGISEVQESKEHWVIKATFVDLETGFTYERPFRQRRSQRSGKQMEVDRAEDQAFQIGCSKAIRNCVDNALPTEAKLAFDEARKSMVDKIGARLPEWRDRCLLRFQELKVDLKRVERLVGKRAADWNSRDMVVLVGQITAIFDGQTTADEQWPAEVQDPTTRIDSDGVVTEGAAGTPAAKATSPPPPATEAKETPDLKPPGATTKPKAPAKPKAAVPPPPAAAPEPATAAAEADPYQDHDDGEGGPFTEATNARLDVEAAAATTGTANAGTPADDFPGDQPSASETLGTIPSFLDRSNPTNIATGSPAPTSKAPRGLFGKE